MFHNSSGRRSIRYCNPYRSVAVSVTKCANRRRFSKLLIKLLLGLPDLFYHSGMHDYVLQVLDNEGEREVRGCKQEVGICTHKIGMEAPFSYSCTLAFRTV